MNKTIDDSFLNPEIQEFIHRIVGKPCCRQSVGEFKSLTVGFGEKIPVPGASLGYRGEWEFITYDSAWRVIFGGQILCGSGDPGYPAELNKILERIPLGCFRSLEARGMDARLYFDNQVMIDILAACHEDNSGDVLVIFGSQDEHIFFNLKEGWKIKCDSSLKK